MAQPVETVDASPQAAINGFIAWLLSIALAVTYLLWVLLPEAALRKLRINYYPDQYWALAAPALFIMSFFYYMVASILLVYITTNPLSDGRCVTDVDTREPAQSGNLAALSEQSSSVPPWADIPVSVASRVLFTPWKKTVRRLQASSPVLTALLRGVDRSCAAYTVDDVYKLAALLRGKEDLLNLRGSADFVRGLQRRCRTVLERGNVEPLNPFQRTLLESVLSSTPKSGTDNPQAAVAQSARAMPTTKTPAAAQPPAATALQVHVNAMTAIAQDVCGANLDTSSVRGNADSVDTAVCTETGEAPEEEESIPRDSSGRTQLYVSSEALSEMELHMNVMAERVRDLGPDDTYRVVKALAMVRYQNYNHTALLARRACEVGPQLALADQVRLFANLQRLRVQDSLTPLVNALCRGVSALSVEQTHQLLHALEHQEHTNAATLRLVGPLTQHAGRQHLGSAPDAGFHRSLLLVLSQYQQSQSSQLCQATMRSLLDPSKNYLSRARPYDLISILQCLVNLRVPAATLAGYRPLFKQLEVSVATLDLRDMGSLLDIVSLLPMDTTPIMDAALERLDKDAGKLSLTHLVFILDLVSSYPPAKTHVATVSLAFAAAVQGHALDVSALEKVLNALAAMELFSDDFVTLLRVLVREKGGFRGGANSLLPILAALRREDLAAHPDLTPLLTQALSGVVDRATEPELLSLRKVCGTLGLTDDLSVVALLSSAHRSTVASGASRRRGWQGTDNHRQRHH